ncbi:IS110 family transposase [Methanospirillum sp. J.3.6.1-F.2.7.3]|uniref:IS110 family transposase n=1 Tax=Methanospirillum purgamenti TaxID=2834276 RepID=A0A8E7AZF0_9EURY|nr:IS110 family transposase [Methanospirillum sp. J.3.6.1-F.2.7.3]QVV87572.1 IS110 family transposase [Methanospirillum sp. J.3.6.1-F.2.7.3]
MTTDYQIAAGLDVHKRFIVATILWTNGSKLQEKFDRTVQGLLALKNWILKNKCQVVACESTSDYWVQIYDSLIEHLPVIVGNAHDIKVLSHKKTDKIDSEIIALLALKGMIAPSRVFSRHHRDFRKLVRLRHFLVKKRTDIKNRIHGILDTELFHLSETLTDIFGVSGRLIMNGILQGDPADKVVKQIPWKVLDKKETEIRNLLEQSLSQNALIQLGHCLRVMMKLDEEIGVLTNHVIYYAHINYPREVEILKSVPGVGDITAVTLIAEIGNFKDFSSSDKLASWLGIVPKVYQSADHQVKRSITKRGSKLGRWILTQAAHAATKKKKNVLRDFYEAKKTVIGTGKAIMALARKMITIIWHLIVNNETYVDVYAQPKKQVKYHNVRIPVSYTLEEALKLLSDTIKEIKKPDPDPI